MKPVISQKMNYRHCLKLFVAAILLSATGVLKAEKHSRIKMPQIREKIQEEKRAFLVKALSLTDEEANGLMPILNELDSLRFKLWYDSGDAGRRIGRGDNNLSEEDYAKHFQQVLDNRVREAELERTYYNRCKQVLPMKKLVRLDRANKAFARRFMREHKRK